MAELQTDSSQYDLRSYSREEWIWLGFIVLGTLIFYLPFLGRQFQGDDWLWLSNAKKALSDPMTIIERPMYGYFRPLNMVIVLALSQFFGASASAFSFVSICLHALNTGLLWIVLRRFGFDLRTRSIAAICFGFYVINCSAIEWISVGHDLWVTLLCLLVILKTLTAIERPTFVNFLQIWLLAAAATLIKESGFVSIGIFFALLVLRGISPLNRQFRAFSLFFLISFSLFLVGYTLTRTVVDRDVSLGIDTFVNLWYFLTYIALPLSQRLVALAPDSIVWVFHGLKVVITVLLPLVAFYVWRRGGVSVRLWITWSVMFVSTIAIMTWDVGLFSLYSAKTAARFMYSPSVGYAVCFAWLWTTELESRFSWLKNSVLSISIVVLYVGLNFAAVSVTSRLYQSNQEQVARTIEDIKAVWFAVEQSDSLIIFSEDRKATRSALGSEKHVEALIYVVFDHQVKVGIKELATYESSRAPRDPRNMELFWSESTKRLMP